MLFDKIVMKINYVYDINSINNYKRFLKYKGIKVILPRHVKKRKFLFRIFVIIIFILNVYEKSSLGLLV